jgi:hypothetical protein
MASVGGGDGGSVVTNAKLSTPMLLPRRLPPIRFDPFNVLDEALLLLLLLLLLIKPLPFDMVLPAFWTGMPAELLLLFTYCCW